MGIREEVLEMKKEVKEIQEHSFAMELLKEDHKKNKRQFIVILILISLLALAMTYIVFLLNDIGITTETIDIDDVETIDNSHIKKEYKKQLYELAYGNVILEDKAIEIVEHMKPYGEHYNIDDAKEIKNDYSIKHSVSDVYLVANSLYNDYHDLLEDNDEMYAKMTKMWLNDADSIEDKVYIYFSEIPKED